MSSNELPIDDGSQAQLETTSENNSSEPGGSSSSAKTQQPMSDAERAAAINDLLNGGSDEQPIDTTDGSAGEGDDDTSGGDDNSGRGDDPSGDLGDQGGSGDGEVGGDTSGPLSLSDVVEKLGVEPEKLYELEIPVRDGEPVTLGNLKDAWQNRQQAERENADRVSDLNERESRIISDQQVWSVLASQGRIPQDQIQKAQQAIQQRLQAESDTLLQLVPEFADNDKRDQFRRDAVRVLGGVGFQPHEVNMADHRHALFVRKFIQMEGDLKAAKAEVKRLTKKEPPKTAKSNGRPLQSQGRVNVHAAARGSESQKVDAVSKLLGG